MVNFYTVCETSLITELVTEKYKNVQFILLNTTWVHMYVYTNTDTFEARRKLLVHLRLSCHVSGLTQYIWICQASLPLRDTKLLTTTGFMLYYVRWSIS